MVLKYTFVVLVIGLACALGETIKENEVSGESRVIESGDDLVAAVTEECIAGDQSIMTCIRQKVMSYMNHLLGMFKIFLKYFWNRNLNDLK